MIEEASKSSKVTVEKRQLFMEMSKLMLVIQFLVTHLDTNENTQAYTDTG